MTGNGERAVYDMLGKIKPIRGTPYDTVLLVVLSLPDTINFKKSEKK